MKAQIVMEYIFVLTFLLVIMVPILNYSLISTSLRVNENRALGYVNTLSKNIDFIHAQGPGAKKIINVPVPSGIDYERSVISNKTIQIVSGDKTFSRSVKANVTGNIPQHFGNNYLTLTYLPSGYIILDNSKILAPTYFSTNLVPLQNYVETFDIENIYFEDLSNIVISTEGPAFVTVNPPTLSGLNTTDTAQFEYRVTAPAASGDHFGKIKIRENDVTMRVIPFAVHIS